MSRPLLLVVDDELPVLRVILRQVLIEIREIVNAAPQRTIRRRALRG